MVIRWPSNRTLAKICVYGGFFCVSSAMYMRYRIEDRIRRTDYFREAFKILRAHPGAVTLLGEPIKETGFDLTNSNKYFCDGRIEGFEVGVKGPNDRGKMFFWGKLENDKWDINRIEVALKSQPDKRLAVKRET